MATPTLIFCADGNAEFAKTAIDAGFLYGAQLPGTIHYPIMFADQNWKKPNRVKYMAALAEHKPFMASVMDWEHQEQLPEVLSWAEEAAQHVECVVLIPKVQGGVAQLSRTIGGKPVRLGYSVPTKYGGTELPLWDFAGWPVHLLGGSPHKQMKVYYHLAAIADVVSADGNMHQKMAIRWCQYWVPGNAYYASNRWWPALKESNDGELWGDGSAKAGAPQEAFSRSCQNIMAAWKAIG